VVLEVQYPREYSSVTWSIIELLTVFAIVVMHEFGHALACRSVGGKADTIMLWPLGGVAYVQAPNRPGATLWSIVAGPLVNVILVPVTILAYYAVFFWVDGVSPDVQHWVLWTMRLNLFLLIFNMLPIYPLDGGQTVYAILWYFMGQARSLRLVAGLRIITAVGIGAWAAMSGHPWMMIMAFFIGVQAARGYQVAALIAQVEAQRAAMRGNFAPRVDPPADR
jgi:Zn-dependent protease